MTGIEEAHDVVILISRLTNCVEVFRTQERRLGSRESIGPAKTYSGLRHCKLKNSE